jgi:hypothetical protein
MAYNKKIWGSDEVITKEALNNIENGIEAVEQSIPKKTSQLENDSGYITEHLDLSNYAEKDELHEHNNKDILDGINLVRIQAWDNAANGENVNLDNYVTKEIFEEFVNNSIEHIFITEAEYEALPEEDKNKDDVLYLITDGESTVINFDNIDNRVKALEEVEHISLEQYNALLERVVQLEEALAALSPSEPEEPTIIPCTSISLNKSSLTFTNANSQTLVATKLPSNTTDTISWKSNEISIATVFNGVVTPKTNGECIITVTCGNYSASCNVLVNIEESVNTYSITNNLTNVSTNNSTTSIEEGQAYNAILTCENDYDISSVVITMNGEDITNSVYDPEDPTT